MKSITASLPVPLIYIIVLAFLPCRSDYTCGTNKEFSKCCTEGQVCDDPDQILIGIFESRDNYKRLHKAFDHINRRPPPYILVTYALNTTTFPLPCDSIYGSGVLPGIASKYNQKHHEFEVWIWSTSPIHVMISPFLLVEFGVLFPWISYDVVFPNTSYSLAAIHGNVCLTIPFQLSKNKRAKNLAIATSRLKSALAARKLTAEAMVSIDVDAQYAISLGKNFKLGAATNPFNVGFHFECAFMGLEISVALVAMYFSNVIIQKYAAAVTAKCSTPELMPLVWAVAFGCMGVNIYLTMKIILVMVAYSQDSTFSIQVRSGFAMCSLAVLVVVSCYSSKRSLHLYSLINVPNFCKLLFYISTFGQFRKRAISCIQFFLLFQVCFFIPLLSVHLVVSCLAVIADPIQNGTALLIFLGILCSTVSLYSALLSMDPLLTATRNSFKQEYKASLLASVKWCYIFTLIVMMLTSVLTLFGLVCIDIRSSFYSHYRVSRYLWYFASPFLLAIVSLLMRHSILHFEEYFATKLQSA